MWQVFPATFCSGATRKLAQILFGALNRISCSIFHTWLTEQTTSPPAPGHFYISTQVRVCTASVAVYTPKSTFFYCMLISVCTNGQKCIWVQLRALSSVDTWADTSSAETVGGTEQLVSLLLLFFLVQPIEMRFSTCRTPACFIISIFRYGVSLQDKLLIKIWAVLPWLSLMLAFISSSWLQVAEMVFLAFVAHWVIFSYCRIFER